MSKARDEALEEYPDAQPYDSYTIGKRIGYRKGYYQAEQDLMEDAVEVEVFDDWQYGKDADHKTQPAIKLRCPELKIGQKVKVIIIKE